MMGGPGVWGRGAVRAGDRGQPQLLPKPTTPWLPPCLQPTGQGWGPPVLTLHEHAGGVGDSALLAGRVARVGARAGAFHGGDAQRPVPHLQQHQLWHGHPGTGHGHPGTGTCPVSRVVAAGRCHSSGDGHSSHARDPAHTPHRGDQGFVVLTCTVSPLWTGRSLLFQVTTGWGLPTALQVRLSAAWSRTSTNAGGVSRKVGGAGRQIHIQTLTPGSGSSGCGSPVPALGDVGRAGGGGTGWYR